MLMDAMISAGIPRGCLSYYRGDTMTEPVRHEDVTGGSDRPVALRPVAFASTRTNVLSRRIRARTRRIAARALAFAPAALVLAVDLGLRGARLAALDPLAKVTYAATVVLGGALWGALLLAATRRRGRLRWVAS